MLESAPGEMNHLKKREGDLQSESPNHHFQLDRAPVGRKQIGEPKHRQQPEHARESAHSKSPRIPGAHPGNARHSSTPGNEAGCGNCNLEDSLRCEQAEGSVPAGQPEKCLSKWPGATRWFRFR